MGAGARPHVAATRRQGPSPWSAGHPLQRTGGVLYEGVEKAAVVEGIGHIWRCGRSPHRQICPILPRAGPFINTLCYTRLALLRRNLSGPSTDAVGRATKREGSRIGAAGGTLADLVTVVPMILESARRLRENVQQVIIGKDEVIEMALAAVLCEGHILLEDVPGIGKTTLARALAVSLGLTFQRIQCTPDLLPSDVTGISWFNQKMQEFEYRAGPVMGQVILADEINRAMPRTQSALLEAMQERQVTVDGVTRRVPRPFMVMATQNPVELEGTFPLPEAQLDRFLVRLTIGDPTASEEGEILVRHTAHDPLASLQPVSSAEEVLEMLAQRRKVRVETSVREYVVAIARATRSHAEVNLGASPRATLALYQTAQAWAAIQGRDYVLPDDVKKVAPSVLTHRLMLSPQAQLRGRDPAGLIADMVAEVPVPVEG